MAGGVKGGGRAVGVMSVAGLDIFSQSDLMGVLLLCFFLYFFPHRRGPFHCDKVRTFFPSLFFFF